MEEKVVCLKKILFPGAWPGEELPLQPVRQELQGAAHVETSPQNPQLRVPGALRGVQKGLQDKMAGRQPSNKRTRQKRWNTWTIKTLPIQY